jgi:hypothetical protein
MRYRKRKALLAERERIAKQWLSDNVDIGKKLETVVAARGSWNSFWLGLQDEISVDIPPDVRWHLQRSVGR